MAEAEKARAAARAGAAHALPALQPGLRYWLLAAEPGCGLVGVSAVCYVVNAVNLPQTA